jgi:hypothetical protein
VLAAIAEQVAAVDPADPARIAQAVELTGTIPDDQAKSPALAAIARQVAAANPGDAARVAQAMELAKTMSDERLRNEALAEIAGASGDLTGVCLISQLADDRTQPIPQCHRELRVAGPLHASGHCVRRIDGGVQNCNRLRRHRTFDWLKSPHHRKEPAEDTDAADLYPADL